MKTLSGTIIITLILAGPAFAQTFSLNTYYPAPYGAYDRVRLVPRTTEPDCNPNLVGLIYYHDDPVNALRVCEGAAGFRTVRGVWTQNNIDINNADVYPSELDLGAPKTVKVGIGTKTPQYDLHIGGGGEIVTESAVPAVYLSDTDANEDDFAFNNPGPDIMAIDADTDDDGTYETSVMTFRSDGHVGISGILNPTADLHIGGGGKVLFDSALSQSLTFNNTAAAGEDFEFSNWGPTRMYFSVDLDDDMVNDASLMIFEENGNLSLPEPGVFLPPAGQQRLNVGGKIQLMDDGVNWGELMVGYDATVPGEEGYYAVYAP